jgi:CRP-like cAMP-binding protein
MLEVQRMVNINEAEKLVEQLVTRGDFRAAVDLLYKMIVQFARQKKFSKAEQLRERLLEVDPLALNEIISSQEIIDEEKEQSLDPIHTEIWSRLYNALSTEEKNALYFSLKDANYTINQTVFSQGDLNPNLFFINQGQLKVIYTDKDGDVLLNTLGPGQLAGQDNFFANTVCTTSAIALTNVNLKYFEKHIMLELEKEFPNLKQKLLDYCSGFQNVTDLLNRKKMDRRSQKRIKISGIGLFNLLNRAGEPIAKSFKGELTDISAGGMAFEIRISKEDTARLLLGRKINANFRIPGRQPGIEIDSNGIIVGVYPYPFEDYSIHIKFDKIIDRSVIDKIRRSIV